MTNETIIAEIEQYISSLNDDDKSLYSKAFELSDRTAKPIKDLKTNCFFPLFNLAAIVQELKQEIKETELKKAGGNSIIKRTKLIKSLLAKCSKEDFRKGWFDEIENEKMQVCIIDGYYGFAFKNALDIFMDNSPKFAFKQAIPDYSNFEQIEFDIADIKIKLKLHKAKKDKTTCLIQIKDKWYSAKFFIDVVDGLGGNVVMYQNPKANGIDVFKSENGIAVLCPARPPKGT